MHLINLLPALGLAQLSIAVALPAAAPAAVSTTSSSGICTNPPKRLEWRQLSIPERRAYIDAVKCLTKKDAISGIPVAINRFDDHQAVHSDQKPNIHWVGHFILWHRYFVATYEKALREECGWTGGQPYWDYSLDAEPQNPLSTRAFDSEIFSPDTGFGGNGYRVVATDEQNRLNITGSTGGGCVKDGPFAPPDFMLNVPKHQCLKRDFTPWIINRFGDKELVGEILAQPDYTSAVRTIEKIPSLAPKDPANIHASAHFGVGGILGTMGDAWNSPGDPLFYMHHGNVDRIFWMWQQRDLETRLNQVGGPVKAYDYSGTNVTLDFMINIGKLAVDATLKDLLNTEGGTLCYTY